MESDKELKFLKPEVQSNEGGDEFLILMMDQLENLQGRVRRGLSYLPEMCKPTSSSCAERGTLEDNFLLQVSRKPRTSIMKKRKRVEAYNDVGIVADNVPNVVISWRNWWAYEGDEDRDLDKLVDKRKGMQKYGRWSRSREHLNHITSSCANEEELNTSYECQTVEMTMEDLGAHEYPNVEAATEDLSAHECQKVETTVEDLSAPKPRHSFNQRSEDNVTNASGHNVAKTLSQIDVDQLFTLSSQKRLTGLECLRSAYSGRSDEFIEESSSSDACNQGLLYQCSKHNLKQMDHFRVQDPIILLPGSSTTSKCMETPANRSCKEAPVGIDDQVTDRMKKVVDDITQNGKSFHHTNIRITGIQTAMDSDVFEYMLQTGQGTVRFNRCSEAGFENSKELSKSFEVAIQDIVMDCPICELPLHGDINKEDDIREVNRHIDSCLSRCMLEA